MRHFNQHRPAAQRESQRRVNPVEPTIHPEPKGHIHPNYRHLVWFRPADGASDSW